MEFQNPREIPVPDDWYELYQKLRPYNIIRFRPPYSGRTLIKKCLVDDPQITSERLKLYSYLWVSEETPPRDIYDERFLAGKYDNHKKSVYAFHDYGGYYGFFRPDLIEIIKISQEIIRSADIVYVTTDTCDLQGNPSSDISICFNGKLDMHTACTSLYPITHEIRG